MGVIRPKLQLQCRSKAFILNMDQTPIPFTFNSKSTLEGVGARTVHVRKSTNDTKCATAAITITASGKMLAPLFVFKGAKNGRIVKKEFPTFDKSMYYACQANAWMDKRVMLLWVEKVLKPYVESAPEGIVPLLLLDSYRCHVMASVVNEIQDLGVEVEHIPGGCTYLCQLNTPKDAASSPTVATESVLLSCVIDAKERRDVATVDIPGAFMQGDQDETVHMRLEGTLAELLTKCDPKLYRQYVVTKNNKPVLYVELVKALYVTLCAALIFWRKLTSKLVEWGFTINPYDWCVANKKINGQQCTLVWHVDDKKISHADPKVVNDIINKLEQEFGKEAPLTTRRGKIHDYLGMTLNFSLRGNVQIRMEEYIRNMLTELPKDMEGLAATPAAEHLLKINDTPANLMNEDAMFFHHKVAKLLFL